MPQPLGKRTFVLGWGRQGLLVAQLAGSGVRSADSSNTSSTVVEPIPVAQPGAAGSSTAMPAVVSGHVLAASFSPDYAWVALVVMERSRQDSASTRSNNLSSVQLVRCRTGRVAATWRPERRHSDPPQLIWARGGNRLLCMCSEVCEDILLGFEG